MTYLRLGRGQRLPAPGGLPGRDRQNQRRERQLRQHHRVVLILKAGSLRDCAWRPGRAPELTGTPCVPNPFRDGDYRVELAHADRSGWVFAVLGRHPWTCASARCES